MRASWWCIAVMVVVGRVAHASPALDKPWFSATPAELLSAAKAAPRGSADVVVLREDSDVSYDDRGRVTSRWRLVFVVATQAGADNWRTLSSSWSPAHQDKPKVRARVIDQSGRVADLDPARMTDEPSVDPTRALPGDHRDLEVPLPPLSVGAVVEEEVVAVDREPLISAGSAHAFHVGGSAPVQSVVIRYSSPPGKKLHVVAHGLPAGAKPKVESVGGRQVTTYTLGAVAARSSFDRFVPGEARPYAYVIATPAHSWSAVARAYRAVVEKQIAAGAFTLPSELRKSTPADTARAIVAWLHEHVRSSSVLFSSSTVVPSTPAETVKRGYGGSLDAATLLVALLRQAGIAAELALINVGPGPDVDRDVPALNVFDHVLVRARIGTVDTWIDPFEELMALGRLPPYDQGRLALVVADGTTALVATPTTPASDSMIREVRTFELAEAGNAKVTEVSREGGVFEADQRTWMRDTAAAAMREELGNYVRQEFDGSLVSYTSTPPVDLGKPFEITLVVKDVGRAYTERSRIDVYLWPVDTLKKLPELLRAPEDDARLRVYDYVLTTPHSYEIENRLVVPPGFTIPKAAPEKVRALGPFKLVEKQRVEGRTLVVTFRLDAAKARLSPAEVASVQQAVRALRKEEAMRVVFSHTALELAERGKLRDALVEANRLVALHPKEALHHQQLAHVLIQAGAGEAARRTMRKALALEPNNADAHVVSAWVLLHDTYGRWLGFDHDRAAAIAALTKARKLDPTHVGAASDLATALEHGAQGRRFDRGSDVRAAVEAWRAAYALEDTADHAYSLAVALIWANEGGEAEKLLRTMPAAERRDQLLVTAVALASGTDAAIRHAETLGRSAKPKALGAAAGMLMLMRRYDAMRVLMGATNAVAPGTPQAQMFQRLARGDKPFKPTGEPRDVVMEMFLGAADESRKTNVFVDAVTRDELAPRLAKNLDVLRRTELVTTGFVEDMLRSASTFTGEGDAGVWRVEITMFAIKFQVYLAGDRRAPKVIATSDDPAGAGRHALRLLAKNDEQSALRLLDWMSRDLAARAQKDPTTHAFAKLWGGSLPRTRHAAEVAAAVLAGDTDTARTMPILAGCKPSTTDGQLACDWELSDLYRARGKWDELLDHAREWSTRAPKTSGATTAQGLALARLGRFDEAERLLADAVAKDPDDTALLFAYADVALARGQLGEAVRRLEPLVQSASPLPGVLNNVAWLVLAEGSDLVRAAELARKGVQQTPQEPHVLNTLAAIEAERGELGEARKYLGQSASAKGAGGLDDSDLYVHARILEQVGLTDDAIAAYRRLKPPDATGGFAPRSADLAARRLKALGAGK